MGFEPPSGPRNVDVTPKDSLRTSKRGNPTPSSHWAVQRIESAAPGLNSDG